MRIWHFLILTGTVYFLFSCSGDSSSTSLASQANFLNGAQSNLEDSLPPNITPIKGRYIVSFKSPIKQDVSMFLEYYPFKTMGDDKEVFSKRKEIFQNKDKDYDVKGSRKLAYSAYVFNAFPYLSMGINDLYDFDFSRFTGYIDESEVSQLRSDPRIRSVVQDYEINQSYFPVFPVEISNEVFDWGLQRVRAIPDKDISTLNKVWIIDSGIDVTQEDLNVDLNLSRSFIQGVDFWDVAGEVNAHGTEVAGVIGAKVNGKGIAGVAPGALVVSLKVMHNGYFENYGFLKALNYVDSFAIPGDVVNISLQDTPGTSEEEYLIKSISEKSIFVVVSAGNSSKNVDKKRVCPAVFNSKNIFTVSAFGNGDKYCSFSNYGLSVDVSAPGENIYSCMPGNKYGTCSGTSFSAPFISGILLLNKSLNFQGEVKNDPDSRIDKVGHL